MMKRQTRWDVNADNWRSDVLQFVEDIVERLTNRRLEAEAEDGVDDQSKRVRDLVGIGQIR